MEVSQQMVIDMILNTVGFLAAGGLSVIVYSAFRGGKKGSLHDSGSSLKIPGDGPGRNGNQAEEVRRVEFIKFANPSRDADYSNNVSSDHAGAMTASSRRNRVEVIRLARKMIEMGASADKVKSVLPISEAELALLTYNTH